MKIYRIHDDKLHKLGPQQLGALAIGERNHEPKMCTFQNLRVDHAKLNKKQYPSFGVKACNDKLISECLYPRHSIRVARFIMFLNYSKTPEPLCRNDTRCPHCTQSYIWSTIINKVRARAWSTNQKRKKTVSSNQGKNISMARVNSWEPDLQTHRTSHRTNSWLALIGSRYWLRSGYQEVFFITDQIFLRIIIYWKLCYC